MYTICIYFKPIQMYTYILKKKNGSNTTFIFQLIIFIIFFLSLLVNHIIYTTSLWFTSKLQHVVLKCTSKPCVVVY